MKKITTLLALITCIVIANAQPIATSVSATYFCPGTRMYVTDTITSTFNAGNNFTIQLSNARGSFASPTTFTSAVQPPYDC